MIDTIFYFVNTEKEYRDSLKDPGISDKTIVFVEESREIYLSGKGYGKTSVAGLITDDEFDAWKDAIRDQISSAVDDYTKANQELADRLKQQLEESISRLNQSISDITDDINATKDDLNGLKEDIDEDIITSINNALKDNNGKDIWTRINEADDGVSIVTTKVNNIVDNTGNIKYNVVQSAINTGIKNNSAITSMLSRWAVADENLQVLEWMASGFKSQALNGGSFAEVFSSATGSNSSALAAFKTEILNTSDNRYQAKSTLSADVTDVVNSLSYLALKADVNKATADITAAYTEKDLQIANNLANLKIQADADHSKVEIITSTKSTGAVTFNQSVLDAAMAEILANNNSGSNAQVKLLAEGEASGVDINAAIQNAMSGYSTKVYVDTAVSNLASNIKDDSGNIISSSSLKEDVTTALARLSAIAEWNGYEAGAPVNYKGGVITQANKESAIASLIASSNDVQSAITAYINGNDSGIILSADKINLDGNVIAQRLTTAVATIGGFSINNYSLSGTDPNTKNSVILSPRNGLSVVTKDGDYSFKADIDGSGSLAYGNINWDHNGYITIGTLNQEFGILRVIGHANFDYIYASKEFVMSYEEGTEDDHESKFFEIKNGTINIDDKTIINSSKIIAPEIVNSKYNDDYFLMGAGGVRYIDDLIDEIKSNIADEGLGYGNISLVTTTGAPQDITSLKSFKSGLIVQGRIANTGDDEGILIKPASNGWAGLILGNNTGERSIFYYNAEVGGIWRWGTESGNWDISHPKETGTIATREWVTSNFNNGNITGDYLLSTGGTMTGSIVFNTGGDSNVNVGKIDTNSIDNDLVIESYGVLNLKSVSGIEINKQVEIAGNLTVNSDINLTGALNLYNSNNNVFCEITSDADGLYLYSEGQVQIGSGSLVEILSNLKVDEHYLIFHSTDIDEHLCKLYANNDGMNFNLTTAGGEFIFMGGDINATDLSVVAQSFSNSSDIRKKDIVANTIQINIHDIANAPLIKFKWKDKEINSEIHVGTTAQYWLTILPEAVNVDKKGFLSMQYDVIAFINSVIIANTVENNLNRIVELEQEISKLKTKLNNI